MDMFRYSALSVYFIPADVRLLFLSATLPCHYKGDICFPMVGHAVHMPCKAIEKIRYVQYMAKLESHVARIFELFHLFQLTGTSIFFPL